MLEVGILKNFDSGTYKAGVQLAGSLTTYFDDISVAKNIPSSALVIGNYVIVAIPGGNPKDACVIATWPGGSPGGGAGSFLDLSDTPSSYEGQAGKIAKVNSDETALEFKKVTGDNLSQDFGASSKRLANLILEPLAGYCLRIEHTGDGEFSALINGNPTATSVVYDNDTGENTLKGLVAWTGTTYWGKVILHNTTRGNSRKIEAFDVTTNTITTESSTDDWADNDVIVLRSQTCNYSYFFDLDLSTKVGAGVIGIVMEVALQDFENAYDADRYVQFNPYEAYDAGKSRSIACVMAKDVTVSEILMPVISQKVCPRILPGFVDCRLIIRVVGTLEYADT